MIFCHSTEALKGRPLDAITPEIASQHYRNYARYEFIVAADGHPWACDLLYAYGKTLEKEAELEPDRSFMLRNQSIACYQAATQIAPSQHEAANQLGYALLHLDRIDEAYRSLTASLQLKPTANAWNNLAEVYRRRGASAESAYAIQQANALLSEQPIYTQDNPEVTELDTATFAKFSPMPMQSPAGPNALSSVGQGNQGAAVPSASSGRSFLSKLIR